MKRIMEMLEREDDCLSLTRCAILLATLEYLVLAPYVVIAEKNAPEFKFVGCVMLVLIFAGIYKFRLESQLLGIKVEPMVKPAEGIPNTSPDNVPGKKGESI